MLPQQPKPTVGPQKQIDLTRLIERAQTASERAGAVGVRKPDPITGKICEQLVPLMKAAQQKGINKLSFTHVVKALAIEFGAPADQKMQFYYTIAQRVRKQLPPELELVKEEGRLFLKLK